MKILVDEMPKTAADCPYSELREWSDGSRSYSCGQGPIGCLQGEPGKEHYCPYYTDIITVIHAKWEMRPSGENGSGEIQAFCSHCGKPNKQYRPPYCPHCGAMMDEDENG